MILRPLWFSYNMLGVMIVHSYLELDDYLSMNGSAYRVCGSTTLDLNTSPVSISHIHRRNLAFAFETTIPEDKNRTQPNTRANISHMLFRTLLEPVWRAK